uniref:P/Homo B domain-containing protein n=1 Tax=Steinernema glaseri TaxID=37863 RepID=A0A1I8AD79_9BILA
MVVTTDLHNSCTKAHTGTSASAPLAAGIVALALEANPGLTWRDLQHIVVRTARPVGLLSGDWKTNGAGRNVSHSFGYGLMDAGAMVRLAQNWSTVPEQRKCRVSFPARYKTIPHGNSLELSLYVDGCQGSKEDHLVYAEHIQVVYTMRAPRRGDFYLYLTSPAGTNVTLLQKRPLDDFQLGLDDWIHTSVHHWGEDVRGTWTLTVGNDADKDAELWYADLVLFGTLEEVGPTGGNDGDRTLSSYALPQKSKKATQGTPVAPFSVLLMILISFCV